MSHLKNAGLFDLLERLANGIVAVVGPHCEIVVHDFSDLEHSAVIVAGNVSGRGIGAPVPDLYFISNGLDSNTSDQLNYRIKIGDRELQSSTIWVRDKEGVPIGAVCINIDYFELNQAYSILARLTANAREPQFTIQDTLAKDMDDLIALSVSAFLRQEGILSIEKMTQDDKRRLVEVVEERGLFKLRGAANRLAEILNVSRASIYNYRGSLSESELTSEPTSG
ncbi:MAG: PAS domain-containing protein [Anaerolineales bacterium]|nr:PAS domain-containing protein [Anaerolineales bacterium]